MDQAHLLDHSHWPSNGKLVLDNHNRVAGLHAEYNMFHFIASSGLTNILFAMLKIGSNSEEISQGGLLGETPLHTAAGSGQLDIVKIFIRKPDVDINALNYLQESPLRYAIERDEKSVVEYLLRIEDGEVEIYLPDQFVTTPLEATSRSPDIMRLLLSHPKMHLRNALEKSRLEGYLDIVEMVKTG